MSVLRFPAPPIIDHGPRPDIWEPLAFIGREIAEFGPESNEPRKSLVIPNFAKQLRLMRRQPGFWNDAIGSLINSASIIDPRISRMRILRYMDTAADEVWSWHSDAYLNTPKRRLDRSWKVPVTTAESPLWSVTINGESLQSAVGTITEDIPVAKLESIVVPPTAKTKFDVALHAATAKEDFYANTPLTIVGSHDELFRWRHGEQEMQGSYDITSAPEGHLIEQDPRGVHIPPASRSAGRTIVLFG